MSWVCKYIERDKTKTDPPSWQPFENTELLLFSLHQLVTKNKYETTNNICLIKIRTKHSSNTYTIEFSTNFYETDVTSHIFCYCHNFKREEARLPLLFSNCGNINKCWLTFGVLLLVF